MKGKTPIVCLTAYTAPMAGLLDPHCDLMLVGDSVGMVVHGLPNTVGVTNVPSTTVTLASPWAAGSDLLLRWIDDNGGPGTAYRALRPGAILLHGAAG